VQTALLEIHQTLAVWSFDAGIPDVPFLWYRPVEGTRSSRDFVDGQWNLARYNAQSFPKAIAGNASTDRHQLGGQRNDILSYLLNVRFRARINDHG
jgi:hypothetical protein